MTEQEAAVLMTLIPGVTPATMRQIVEQVGSLAEYFTRPPVTLPSLLAYPGHYVAEHGGDLGSRIAAELDHLERRGIHIISLASDDYPLLLREIHRPPPILYVKGDPALLSLPQVAIIGSRRASRGGIEQAEQFATALTRGGFTVTSGMALGIDGAAHRGALKAGKTIAVLGSGVDVAYPRQHQQLYDDILARGGAIVSEFPPGTGPLRPHFPQRNRIISGLSLGILVIEAAAQSGSLITARLAMEQGREVFAIPGSIHNPLARGCHQLIREGAILTETLDDMVTQLGGMLSFKAEESVAEMGAELPANGREHNVLKAMGFDPVTVDRLQQLLDMETAALTVALVNLELQGYVENTGGCYQRCR